MRSTAPFDGGMALEALSGGGIVSLTVASVALAQWMIYVSPPWSFYLLPMRFWEFAAGALCAWLLYPKKIRINSLILNNILGIHRHRGGSDAL